MTQNQNLRLQVPISSKIKKALERKAEDEGFSSANDLVRLMIHRFLLGDFNFQMVQSPKSYPMLDLETEKRLYQSLQEIKNGDYDLIDLKKNPNAFLDLYKE